MDIKEQFNAVAKEYDQNRRRFIPCFDDYYLNSTKMNVAGFGCPKRILDLGAGTGLLSYYWYNECPDSQYVLVDIADEMLNIAEKRFAGIDNVRLEVCDYTQALPEGDFDGIVSALSIHHLEHDQKQSLFKRIHEKLPPKGLFVNYDQFCTDSPEMDKCFNSFWENQIAQSGLTEKDVQLWQERKKLDRECSVTSEMDMLWKSGFSQVQCIYQYHKFAVIVAIK